MARLSWTEEAAESLRDIFDFIAQNRPRTAERTIESIVNKVDSLAASPSSGQRYPYAEGADVHQLTYGHFRIAYELVGDHVIVLGVFHGLIFLPRR